MLLFRRISRRLSPTSPSNRRLYTSDKGRCLPTNGSSGGRSRLCRDNLRHQSRRPELAGWWFFWHSKCVSSRSPEISTGGWSWAQTCTYIPRVRQAHPAISCGSLAILDAYTQSGNLSVHQRLLGRVIFTRHVLTTDGWTSTRKGANVQLTRVPAKDSQRLCSPESQDEDSGVASIRACKANNDIKQHHHTVVVV